MEGATSGLVGELARLITLFGAEWVLWLLLGLSVVSIGVMVERWWYYFRRRFDTDRFAEALAAALRDKKIDQARKLASVQCRCLEARVIEEGLSSMDQGPRIAEEAMGRAVAREKRGYESKLWFLGTLGNNAPFIGLFGTVLGIIKAFAELSTDVRGGASVVMGGISEALVATAVGLIVALPAVVAFNLCKKTVRKVTTNAEVLSRTILVHAREQGEQGSR